MAVFERAEEEDERKKKKLARAIAFFFFPAPVVFRYFEIFQTWGINLVNFLKFGHLLESDGSCSSEARLK